MNRLEAIKFLDEYFWPRGSAICETATHGAVRVVIDALKKDDKFQPTPEDSTKWEKFNQRWHCIIHPSGPVAGCGVCYD